LGGTFKAVCDEKLRFMYVAVAGPGNMPDITAYRKSSLMQFLDALPYGKYLLGDAAYPLSEQLLTPYTGSQRHC